MKRLSQPFPSPLFLSIALGVSEAAMAAANGFLSAASIPPRKRVRKSAQLPLFQSAAGGQPPIDQWQTAAVYYSTVYILYGRDE